MRTYEAVQRRADGLHRAGWRDRAGACGFLGLASVLVFALLLLVAMLSACSLIALGLTGCGRGPSQPSSLATALGHLQSRDGSLHNLILILEASPPLSASLPAPSPPSRWQVGLRRDTSWMQRSDPPGFGQSYLAADGTYREWRSDGEVISGEVVFRGLPVSKALQRRPLWLGMRAYVRVLLGERPAAGEEVLFEGRPAWRVQVPWLISGCSSPSTVGEQSQVVTVDKATMLPVAIALVRAGEVVQKTVVTRLLLDSPQAEEQTLFDFPPGAQLASDGPLSRAQRRVTLAQASRVAGTRLLLPARLPKGFRLVGVSVSAPRRGLGGGGGPTVSLIWSRGIDWLGLDIYAGRAMVNTPGPAKPGPGALRHRFRLGGGALAGAAATAEADLVQGVPQLYVHDVRRRLDVIVYGDLTFAGLTGVAESLRPYRAP